ncbi:FGGY-family carbohydrate kinase [Xanthovirga aplysinae]|uniref:FGGY-family carbohydrate kinase n=1 Tax=Xanthovirga aplysinae TaxID=2529853 RepID=UPI0012BC3961|nr:FGGY-family carbohydrate kinase [Xanthovirga aplysinae]MTI31397.1 carbohydrate kinase [Xanthovirga aplysinae]
MEPLLISLDAGTQSVRAALYDLKGQLIDICKIPIEPYFSTQPGWAEQEPEYYWEKLCEATQGLVKNNAQHLSAIQGICVTTQRATVINLDKNGRPLRPAIVWLDQRKAKLNGDLEWWLKWPLKIAGQFDLVKHVMTESESRWLMQNQQDVWKKTAHYVYLSGYFYYKLVGEIVESKGNMVGYMPFDYKKMNWAEKGDLKHKFMPVEKEKLSPLVDPGTVVGQLTAEAAEATGLPKGLKVIAGAADKACEVLGSGCIEPDWACLSFGTTATVETCFPKYVEVIPFMPSYPSAIPGHYNTEVMVFRGFWMVSWFKQQFGSREVKKAKKLGIAPEILFDELIREIPPGSMGLTLQPYWSPGIKTPGPEAKGAIIGFGDVHTRAHIYRAILEGLAYSLKEGLEQTQKATKVKVKALKISGGGSQSDEAMQLTSNVFNLPAYRPHTFETSSLGAAMLGAVGLGFMDNYKMAVNEMCHTSRVFEPQKEVVSIYEDLYKDVYQKMYHQLKPLYHSIGKITGYPRL